MDQLNMQINAQLSQLAHDHDEIQELFTLKKWIYSTISFSFFLEWTICKGTWEMRLFYEVEDNDSFFSKLFGLPNWNAYAHWLYQVPLINFYLGANIFSLNRVHSFFQISNYRMKSLSVPKLQNNTSHLLSYTFWKNLTEQEPKISNWYSNYITFIISSKYNPDLLN